MATIETFTKMFSALLAAYPDARIAGNATAQVFFAALQDVPDENLALAVAEWIAHGKRFPSVADLRELAFAEEHPLPDEAWGEVKRAFVAYGRDAQPSFSDPLIGETVDSIGWESLCASDVKDEPIVRAQFIAAYRARVERATFDRTSLVRALGTMDFDGALPD